MADRLACACDATLSCARKGSTWVRLCWAKASMVNVLGSARAGRWTFECNRRRLLVLGIMIVFGAWVLS